MAGRPPGREHTGTVRLFIAVEPPETVLRLLGSLPRPDRPDLRWTTPAQWHVTLRFLGELDDPAAVTDALRAAGTFPGTWPVEARVGPATSWFPGGRVLQVPVAGLDTLSHWVTDATGRWGTDELPFHGHLTLARARGRGPGPAELAGVPISARFDVIRVVLFASCPGPGGSAYDPVACVGLVGPPVG